MPTVVHTMPVLIRNEIDVSMLKACLESLSQSIHEPTVIFYNQGEFSSPELREMLDTSSIHYQLLGHGANDGIPTARQQCFEFVWSQYPECNFITEIHQDMIFPSGWTEQLQEFLETNPEEPCICPGIITAQGEWHPHQKGASSIPLPETNQELLQLLHQYERNETVEGFVHPVMHRSDCLKKVGGYNLQDLPGKQGFEDDYLLLAYYNQLRLPFGWRPKADLRTCVFHHTMAQRMGLSDMQEEASKNHQGLLHRFGTQGIEDLKRIHSSNPIPNRPPPRTEKMLIYFGAPSENKEFDCLTIPGFSTIVAAKAEDEYEVNGVLHLPLKQISALNPKNCIAIVSHPYWQSFISGWKPNKTVAVLFENVENQAHTFYSRSLKHMSDIIITDNEELFFENSLKHPCVFWTHPPMPASLYSHAKALSIHSNAEELLVEILLMAGEDLENTALDQLRLQKRHTRVNELKNSLEWNTDHEMIYSTVRKIRLFGWKFRRIRTMLV